jgi:hypothetical protein
MFDTFIAALLALVVFNSGAFFLKWLALTLVLVAKRAKTEAELRRMIDEATNN